MVKKNVLTPVLAGVLGVTIVGSGVGYFVLNKDADKNGSEKTKNEASVTVSPKLSVMAENISNTLDKAQEIADGSVDYAYEGSVNYSFGSFVTNNTGMEIKDIGIKVSSKQKGGNEGGDVTVSYDGKDLFTVNEVYNRENSEEMYVKIPELSDAYIKVNRADAENYLKDEMGMDMSQYTAAAQDIDFDVDAFEADLKEYEQLIKDNFPEVKEEGKKEGDIDGVSYSYTSKSYDVTSEDANKIATAVLEKAKTDENFKKLYEDGVEKSLSAAYTTSAGAGEAPTYESMIDDMLESVKADTASDDKVALEMYENGDGDFMGFTLKPDGEEGELRYIVASSDSAEGMDVYFDSGDGETVTVYGALKSDNDVVNGTYTMSSTEDGKEVVKVVYTVTDLQNVGENFSGTIRIDAKTDDEYEGAASGWVEIVSASTADDVDVTFDIGVNGESAVTMKVTGSKTEATDVEVPSADATIYNALDEEELNKYIESCDTEGFMNKIKDAMGEEMFNAMFGGADAYGSGNNVEYNFDDENDDFDWEQFETELDEAAKDEADKPA